MSGTPVGTGERTFLFVSHNPAFGGPENQALRLVTPLADRGWNTVLVVSDEPGSSWARLSGVGIPVIPMPLRRLRATRDLRVQSAYLGGLPLEIARLAGLIRERGIDAVIVAGFENPQAAVAGYLTGRPVIWQILGSRTPMLFRRVMMPLVWLLADVVMPTGTGLLGQYPGAARIADRIVPFFPPVDPVLFEPSAPVRARVRAELGIREDEVLVGTVANINAQKDHFTFLRAARSLANRHPNVRFAMLGETSASQQEYAAAVWAEAGRLGFEWEKDLIHRSPGQRVHELGQALDIFWMTSEGRSEGVPTAMLEAMHLGVPVVATNVGGVADVIVPGSGGRVAPPSDPEALARATDELVADESFRRAEGCSARTHVRAEAGLDRCVEQHVLALTRAKGRSASSPGAARRRRWWT